MACSYGTVATELNDEQGGRHAVHLELLKDPAVVNAGPSSQFSTSTSHDDK
jgi:hypothetical protein